MGNTSVDLASEARARAEVLHEDDGNGVDHLSATLFEDLAIVIDSAREVSECFAQSGPLSLAAPWDVLEKKIEKLRAALSGRSAG